MMSTVHDPDYRAAFQDFTTFTEKVSDRIVAADELIPELPVKDVVSRVVFVSSPVTSLIHIDLSSLSRRVRCLRIQGARY